MPAALSPTCKLELDLSVSSTPQELAGTHLIAPPAQCATSFWIILPPNTSIHVCCWGVHAGWGPEVEGWQCKVGDWQYKVGSLWRGAYTQHGWQPWCVPQQSSPSWAIFLPTTSTISLLGCLRQVLAERLEVHKEECRLRIANRRWTNEALGVFPLALTPNLTDICQLVIGCTKLTAQPVKAQV